MAEKKISSYIKLQIPAGQANPAPPVGPALGQHGVNIMEFCKAFNDATKEQTGMIIPVVITVYADRSFTFITKTPPAAVLLKKKAGVPKGSGEPNREKVGKLTRAQLEEIAKQKEPDLNSNDIDKQILDKEQELIAEELKNSGKPEEIAKKISLGKLNKFKEENSLMSQPWVMEPKKKVKEILSEINISSLKINEFVRIKIGE